MTEMFLHMYPTALGVKASYYTICRAWPPHLPDPDVKSDRRHLPGASPQSLRNLQGLLALHNLSGSQIP